MIDAVPAASELSIPLVARYAVAWPFGDSFKAILPALSVTPESATPLNIWMITTRGMVMKYLSGMVVKGHARIQMRKRGPLTESTDLLLNLSESLPHIL